MSTNRRISLMYVERKGQLNRAEENQKSDAITGTVSN
jgi:hypothetical protein